MIVARRQVALAVVPAVLAVGAVAGCNDSAPTVQAPASTVGTSAADTGVPTVQATEGDGSESSSGTGVPTVTAAPTSSSADPSKVCTTNDDFDTPAEVGPSTKKAAWGKPLVLKPEYAGVVTLTAKKPVSKKPSDDDYFGPGDGQVDLLITVSAKYKSGDSTFLADTDFTLRDAKDNVCDTDLLGNVVQHRERFDSATIDADHKTYTGTLVFAVPAGQDYSKYVLMYLPDNFGKGGSDAPVAWTG